MVRRLLNSNSILQTLHLAARNKSRKCAKVLLKLGADPLWESKEGQFFYECWPTEDHLEAGGASAEAGKSMPRSMPPIPVHSTPTTKARAAPLSAGGLTMPSKEERDMAFGKIDFNDNGALSLAEIDKAVIALWPELNNKPALMRAYKAADKNGNGFINRREFRLLLEYLIYFNDLWAKFEEIDGGKKGDRPLSLEEFKKGCSVCNLDISAADAEAEFAAMDQNGGGFVLFDEFCPWIAKKFIQNPPAPAPETPPLSAEPTSPSPKKPPPKSPRSPRSPRGTPVRASSRTEAEDAPSLLVKIYQKFETIDRPTRLFRQIDDRNTGSIPVAELRNALRILKMNLSVTQCQLISDMLDSGDGLLSIENFITELHKAYLASLRASLMNSGNTSISAFTASQWQEMFHEEKITFEGFCTTVRSRVGVGQNSLSDDELLVVFQAFASRSGLTNSSAIAQFMKADDLFEYVNLLPTYDFIYAFSKKDAGKTRQAFATWDKDGSGELDYEEFTGACKQLRLRLTREEIKMVCRTLDTTGDDSFSYEEFMQRMRKIRRETETMTKRKLYPSPRTLQPLKSSPADTIAGSYTRTVSASPGTMSGVLGSKEAAAPKQVQLEPSKPPTHVYTHVKVTMPSKEERDKAFGKVDFNGNGALSLAEIDKAVITLWPELNNKPALMRAYKAADKNGNGFINRREFRLLLEYLIYFNDLWAKFEEIDGGKKGDRPLSLEEFKKGCSVCNLDISAADAEAEFAAMDQNGGGFVLFDEFCPWIANKHLHPKQTPAQEIEPVVLENEVDEEEEDDEEEDDDEEEEDDDTDDEEQDDEDEDEDQEDVYEIPQVPEEERPLPTPTQLEVSKPSGLLAGVLGAEPTAPKPQRAQTKASAAPLPDYVEDAEGGLTLSAADDGGGGQGAIVDRVLAQVFAALTTSADVMKTFKQADMGNEGMLDGVALRKALTYIGTEVSKKDAGLVLKALDKDGDGKVSLEEFLTRVWASRIGVLKSKFKAASYHNGKENYSRLFHNYDRDNSGMMDFDEFRSAVRRQGGIGVEIMPDEALEHLFQTIDQDRDGTIGTKEFVVFMKAKEVKKVSLVDQAFSYIYDHTVDGGLSARVAFGKFDTDGSGELDKKEFAQACKLLGLKLGKQEMRLVFSSLDSTGDNTISADEFMQRMRKVKRDRIASGGGATRASLTSANTGALNSLAKAKAALPSEAQASPRPSPRRRERPLATPTQLEVSKPSGLLAGVFGGSAREPEIEDAIPSRSDEREPTSSSSASRADRLEELGWYEDENPVTGAIFWHNDTDDSIYDRLPDDILEALGELQIASSSEADFSKTYVSMSQAGMTPHLCWSPGDHITVIDSGVEVEVVELAIGGQEGQPGSERARITQFGGGWVSLVARNGNVLLRGKSQ